MSFLAGSRLILACAPLLLGCANAGPIPTSNRPVDFVTDCQDQPYYDTLSASDHTTVIKGMTPRQREECLRLQSEHHNRGM